MGKIINVVANNNRRTQKVRKNLINMLEQRDYIVPSKFDHGASLTISIGGDGGFLKTVHRNNLPQTPIVGINTGTLGFFQEIDPNEIEEFLDEYEAGNYEIGKHYLLEAQVVTRGRIFRLNAVNEIILKAMDSRIIQMNVYIEGNHLEKFAGDGMLVATPTGSTAYNFSLNGAIVHPALTSMQLTPIAPIHSKAYRSLDSSLVVPKETEIILMPTKRYKDHSKVVYDGNEKKYYNLKEVRITTSDVSIKVLHFKKDFYWNNLKDKFL